MTVDVVNSENKKVGTAEVSDAVFGGRVKTDLIHESWTLLAPKRVVAAWLAEGD